MNADLFLHIATFCPVHELLHDWMCVCKQWKTWLTGSAANVRLWMKITEHLFYVYRKQRGLSPFLSLQAYQHVDVQHKVDWRTESINIQRHLIASSYVEHVQFDHLSIYKIPREKANKGLCIETEATKWFYYARTFGSEEFVLVKSSHEPISKSFTYTSTSNIRYAVLGFNYTHQLWMIERGASRHPFCIQCHSIVAPTETNVRTTYEDGVYCKNCL